MNKMSENVIFKKLMVCIAPLAFAIVGYLILFFSAKSLISPAMSIVDMLSSDGTQIDENSYSDIYTGEIFHQYTDFVPSSEITFPLANTKYGEISIENTSVSCPLIYGDNSNMLHKGACQYMGSSFPGFGSTILISGHNNSYFNGLKDAKVGSVIKVSTNYGNYTYRITGTAIKSSTDKSAYDLDSDVENIILYTCYPFNALGLTSQRYFVYGEYVSGPLVQLDK